MKHQSNFNIVISAFRLFFLFQANICWAFLLRDRAIYVAPTKFHHSLRQLPSHSKANHALLMTQTESAASEAKLREKYKRTQQILDGIGSNGKEAGGAGGFGSFDGLLRLDSMWSNMKNNVQPPTPPKVVTTEQANILADGTTADFDVTIVGGTLGVLLGCALQKRGLKVGIIERAPLRGREQEWNISKHELKHLVDYGIITEEELESAIIATEFNPMRNGFSNGDGSGTEVWINDVLNVGVKPDELIARARATFERSGGTVMELTNLSGVKIYDDAARLTIQRPTDDRPADITTSLVIDCCGHASPIVRQIRHGERPDGICIVVGTCGLGYPVEKNTYGDIIYTNNPISTIENGPVGGEGAGKGSSSSSFSSSSSKLQYFWEAFPNGADPSARTTYLFTYMDATPTRPSVLDVMESYWDMLPAYQNVSVSDLQFLRALYGVFPTYKTSPLKPAFDRVLQVGDASGVQSPLSFGGLGALMRHMPRLVDGITDAVEGNLLDKRHLGGINPYMPSLSVAWMFQKSMSVPPGASPSPTFINDLLGAMFAEMASCGDEILRPFLQDVIQFGALLRALSASFVADPLVGLRVVPYVGPAALLDWSYHFVMLGVYTALHNVAGKNIAAYFADEEKEES